MNRVIKVPQAKIEIGNGVELLKSVKKLRHQVFCVEEDFQRDMVDFPLDVFSTHILIWHGKDAVACVTVVPPEDAVGYGREVGLLEEYVGRAALATKLVVHPEYRGINLPSLIVACMDELIFGPAGFRYAFVVLMGNHCSSEQHYQKIAACFRVAEGECVYGRRLVLVMDRESQAFALIRDNILRPQRQAFIRGDTFCEI